MLNVMRKLWKDEAGFVITVELILVATILVIGLVAGFTMLRDSVLAELSDMAQAIGAIDQSWGVGGTQFTGSTPTEASTARMAFSDAPDSADQAGTVGVGLATGNGLSVTAPQYDYDTDTLESQQSGT